MNKKNLSGLLILSAAGIIIYMISDNEKKTNENDKYSTITKKLLPVVPQTLQPYAKDSIPLILKRCDEYGVLRKDQIAYILGTAQLESGLGRSMLEYASGEAYEGSKTLGNINKGDGVKYKGRGFVQITGRNHYKNFSKVTGVDLLNNPDLAKDFNIASRILVYGMKTGSFTGRKLDHYFNDKLQDWYNARRIVNGIVEEPTQLIKQYALKFYNLLK